MRVEDFELPELCGVCGEDVASVYVVMRGDTPARKAQVCFRCFGQLEERGVQSVSLQEFNEMVPEGELTWGQ
jgi:hypothetical protein